MESAELAFDLELEEHTPEAVAGVERNFGDYQLRYQIASGGMGTVYLARDFGPAGFVRAVAVKRIHPHLAGRRKFVDMFLDEARIISRISHPNVCRIYDFGQVGGTYYMAMEYLVGESLAGVMNAMVKDSRRFDEPRWHALACRIIADAAEGLHAAHELEDESGKPLNVVHRDVSPHNLFVNYDGSIRVLDFGVAFAAERLHHSTTGTVKGKYAYMAPEQIKSKDFDRRADIWALGVCLWEMLTAQRLFRRDSEVDTILAVGSVDIEPPSVHRNQLAPSFDRVVLKALQRDPDNRYATAREFGRDLLNVASQLGVSAGPAELSDWLKQLFYEQRQEKLHMVETVLESPSSAALKGVHELNTMLGDSQTTPLVQKQLWWRPSSRRRLVMGMLIACIALGLVVLGLALGHNFAQSPPQSAALPSAVKPVEPVLMSPLKAFGVEVPQPPTDDNAKGSHDRSRSGEKEPAVGFVNIVTQNGWADVYEGHRFLGRTPRQIRLGEGRHVLEIRAFGKEPSVRRPVTVKGDRVTRVVIDLGRP
jgi:serine/threonine protein kinase